METAYEAVYIVDTNLPDDQFTGIIDKYQGVVTRGNGTIDDMDRWEPRRLAYPIKGRREGVYVVMNFRSEPPARDERRSFEPVIGGVLPTRRAGFQIQGV